MPYPLYHSIWVIVAGLLGACVGSFLNVAIYRLPLNMRVDQPKRSFCPRCKYAIPWYQNLPVLSWCLLRGRCAKCEGKIAFRYVCVEILTAILFIAAWLVLSPLGAVVAWVMISLLVAITFIDAEHMIIPSQLTTIGVVAGLLGGMLTPGLVELGTEDLAYQWWQRGGRSILGAIVGFGALSLVVLLGKKMFGKVEFGFETVTDWSLREPETEEEELCLIVDGEATGWGEMFYRKSDRVIIDVKDLQVDGQPAGDGELTLWRDSVQLGGQVWQIEDLKSLSGTTQKVTIPREAMGDGDPYLLAMIGAFLGYQSLLFVILVSCLTAIFAAVAGRVGLGKALPYGPFLAMGGLVWALGGWEIWEWYLTWALAG